MSELERVETGLGEECGVFGAYDMDGGDVAPSVYYGLFALQHRGQESCGIAVTDTYGKRKVHFRKGLGLVNEVFDEEELGKLKGNLGVGHVRYSTAGGTRAENAQPLVLNYVKGTLVIAHNGNLTNAIELRHELEYTGAIFQTTIDSEVIAYHIARERLKVSKAEDAVRNAMKKIEGAYALVVSSPRKMIGARDPFGLKPLCIGKRDNTWFLASESCALAAVGADFIRDVEPGEIVSFTKHGVSSDKSMQIPPEKQARCIFEYIYFARPDSVVEGINVHAFRKATGSILAREDKDLHADIVIGVPDSSLSAAIGYAEEAGIPFETGLIKNRYVGRTFIQPTQAMRDRSVRLKLSPVSSVVKGKSIVMIDDSIVRGTTSRRIVQLLKDAGATQVHVRIASPVITSPCFYGVDTSTKDQLIGAQMSVEEIRDYIHADTLRFMTEEEMKEATHDVGLCLACFNGEYCTKLFSYQEELDK